MSMAAPSPDIEPENRGNLGANCQVRRSVAVFRIGDCGQIGQNECRIALEHDRLGPDCLRQCFPSRL